MMLRLSIYQPCPLGSLTLWCIINVAVATRQCNNCGDLQFLKRDVLPLPAPLILGTVASPLYGVLETNISSTRHLDNYCFTFFPITSFNYVNFRSYVYSDGSYRVEKVFFRDILNKLGYARVDGIDHCGTSTIILEEIALGLGCPLSFCIVRNYLYGKCDIVNQLEGKQVRYAITAQQSLPKVCIDLLKTIANSRPELDYLDPETGFIVCPNKLPRRCVTRFNNASCVGADRVAEEDSISLPCCDCFS